MEKTREELQSYAQKMLERGDRWASIVGYLDRQNTPPDVKKEIINHLEMLENAGVIKKPDPSKKRIDFNIILGVLFIGGGILMTLLLWNMGWISTVPFIVIAGGVWAITRQDERKRAR